MRRLLTGAAAGAVLVLAATLCPAVAAADDTATISHVEVHDNGRIAVLVSVPEGAEVDLSKVTVAVEGEDADASAAAAGAAEADTEVRRRAVLAIDTSDSMKGARFDSARAAAGVYLDTVPDDVEVGIVTFDAEVRTLLEPTTDRASAEAVVASLELARGTRLYDGIRTAVDELGDEGQRTVLVLSDGRNTNDTQLTDVTAAIEESGVQLDAVALDQAAADTAPLQALVDAGKGALVPADPSALSSAFAAEAASLARQVLVTAEIPSAVTAEEGTIEVSLPTSAGVLTASTFAPIGDGSPTPSSIATEVAENALQLPTTAMYGGLAALGLGLLVLFGGILQMAGSRTPRTVEQRIAAYGSAATPSAGAGQAQFNLNEMKDAAASMLHRNRGLEARIERRLEAAGNALKPAEWLLLHGLIAILGALIGLLLGGGSVLLLLLGLLAGLLLPWWWLGFKEKRRVKAFNSGLADTLQLIAGSLSAGMSLAQSVDAVVNEGNEPIASEFKRVLVETRLGVPLEVALEGIAQRIKSVDFAWVVMAIRIQREVGGNLAELLKTVGGTLRERDYLRRQVQTLSAEGKLSAYILIGLPIGLALYLLTVRREYIMPMFSEPLGWMLVAAASFLLAIGWFAMSRIVKVEV